jgi:hypothetical protein
VLEAELRHRTYLLLMLVASVGKVLSLRIVSFYHFVIVLLCKDSDACGKFVLEAELRHRTYLLLMLVASVGACIV